MCLKDISLSIITPTYNRVDLLKNCFSSLLVQTCYDFEWIIVDDGSSDQTKEIFSEIAKKKLPFKMTYVWKENLWARFIEDMEYVSTSLLIRLIMPESVAPGPISINVSAPASIMAFAAA